MTYREWMEQVDDLCMTRWSMSIHDLPDLAFYDAYDSRQSPEEFMDENLGSLDDLRRLVMS